MKLRWKTSFTFLILCFSLFFIVINLIFGLSPDFSTPTTCSITWDDSCNSDTLNDAFNSSWNGTHDLGCNGTLAETGLGVGQDVQEVYLNATAVLLSDAINATCQFLGGQQSGYAGTEWMFYYNGTEGGWMTIANWTDTDGTPSVKNRSVVFIPNNTAGVHYLRCTYRQRYDPTNFCANYTGEGDFAIRDNDDLNFTVTDYLKYTFWNLTNYTTGAEIASGQTYNRTDSSGNTIYLNVSANWTRNVSYATIEHNGTGTFVNYSITSYIIGNWTNATINLSDATQFNRKNITINAIYANDSFDQTNKTSPPLYFNLNPGLAPNVTSLWLEHLGTETNNTNAYTNFTIFSNVSDDVGIFSVTANLTYPNNNSITLNLTGNPNPVNRTWNYTFETVNIPLNETGNYTISWVKVNDTGDSQVNMTLNQTFYVNDTLTVSSSVSSSNPGKGDPFNVVISVLDVNSNYHEHPVNLTIDCVNRTYLQTNFTVTNLTAQTTFTHCYAPNSYSTAFNVTINATDVYNNTGQSIETLTSESAPATDGTTGGGGSMGGGGGNVTIINATANVTDFNFTLSQSEIQIYRGEDATIVGALSNTGDTNLTLSSSIYLNSTCCVISINPSEFTLNVGGSEVPFTISIHVNTTTKPDTEHFADLTLKSGTLEKSKRIKIIVKENPVISSLDQVSGQISEAEAKISEYVKAGLDVSFLQDLLNRIKGTKSESATALEQDDIIRLRQQNDFIQSSLKQINDELNNLALLKAIYENKYSIVTGLAIGLVSTYLVTQIVIPYFKIQLEIRNLILERASLSKSRVETTKSFFLRKIDEKTFRTIISDRQGKIYKLKSMIDLKNEEKSNLLRERLNPLYMGKLIREKISKIRSKKK